MFAKTLADLKGDAANPRKISERSKAALAVSIGNFGDISGIVFNTKTKHLVCGHQRVDQLRDKYGDLELVEVDKNTAEIVTPDKHRFRVRLVSWSVAKERAANVAANSKLLSGEFTDDLGEFLDVAKQGDGELFDDLLLGELVKKDSVDDDVAQDIEISYQVIVECDTEAAQREVFERLTGEGLTCKTSTW